MLQFDHNIYPLVSIIMPVYNAEKYLELTIESILNQDYPNIEILIIDDCSTDNSYSILKKYTDTRIKLSKNETNIGYVKTLNNLIKASNGFFIARHDNDDISKSNRIRLQVNYLLKNLNVDVCGSNFNVFGNKNIYSNVPLTNEEIKCFMLLNNPICHPTVMFRSNIFKDHNFKYDTSFSPSEDYLLWYKISKETQLENLNESLLSYRWHSDNTSIRQKEIQISKTNEIRNIILNETLGIILNECEQKSISNFIFHEKCSIIDIKNSIFIFIKIINKNNQVSYYNNLILKNIISNYFITTLISKDSINIFHKLYLIFSSGLLTRIIFVQRFQKIIKYT